MKRRLDLAAALIHEPSVLFLDEPTTGLDPLSRQMVWEEVRRLNDQGVTIFLTTQYLEEADELADRVGIIADGRLVAEGPPDELKRSIGTDVVLVKVAGDPAAVPDALARPARCRAGRCPGRHRRHLGDRRGEGRQPGGGGDRRVRGDGAPTSACGPPRSTTCSSSSPAATCKERTDDRGRRAHRTRSHQPGPAGRAPHRPLARSRCGPCASRPGSPKRCYRRSSSRSSSSW